MPPKSSAKRAAGHGAVEAAEPPHIMGIMDKKLALMISSYPGQRDGKLEMLHALALATTLSCAAPRIADFFVTTTNPESSVTAGPYMVHTHDAHCESAKLRAIRQCVTQCGISIGGAPEPDPVDNMGPLVAYYVGFADIAGLQSNFRQDDSELPADDFTPVIVPPHADASICYKHSIPAEVWKTMSVEDKMAEENKAVHNHITECLEKEVVDDGKRAELIGKVQSERDAWSRHKQETGVTERGEDFLKMHSYFGPLVDAYRGKYLDIPPEDLKHLSPEVVRIAGQLRTGTPLSGPDQTVLLHGIKGLGFMWDGYKYDVAPFALFTAWTPQEMVKFLSRPPRPNLQLDHVKRRTWTNPNRNAHSQWLSVRTAIVLLTNNPEDQAKKREGKSTERKVAAKKAAKKESKTAKGKGAKAKSGAADALARMLADSDPEVRAAPAATRARARPPPPSRPAPPTTSRRCSGATPSRRPSS